MLFQFLESALASPFGIEIDTKNPRTLQGKLYKIKREAMDPRYDTLKFKISPKDPSSKLWIIKTTEEGKEDGEEKE